MGFWSVVKRGLGIGPPRTSQNRRLRRRQSGSVLSSGASAASFASSQTATHTQRPSGSLVLVEDPDGGPEDIRILEDEPMVIIPNRGRQKKRMFGRRLSKKKRPNMEPPLPSTSDLMRGVAPAPSVADDTAFDRIREAGAMSPHRTHSVSSFPNITPSLGQISRPPSVISRNTIAPTAPTTSIARGSLSQLARSPAHPPTPPLHRQTPRLTTLEGNSATSFAAASRARTTPSARRISVREVTGPPDNLDVHSIAALSQATRPPKVARIFEIADVIPGERPLSAVTEESGASPRMVNISDMPSTTPLKQVGGLAAIEHWASGHKARLDVIDSRLQTLKAEVLQQKKMPVRYF